MTSIIDITDPVETDEVIALRAERRLWISEAIMMEIDASNARRQAELCDREIARLQGLPIPESRSGLMRDRLNIRTGAWTFETRRGPQTQEDR